MDPNPGLLRIYILFGILISSLTTSAQGISVKSNLCVNTDLVINVKTKIGTSLDSFRMISLSDGSIFMIDSFQAIDSTFSFSITKRDTLQLTLYASDSTYKDTLIIRNLPKPDLGKDTSLCGDSITLSAGRFTSYAWNTGATSTSLVAKQSGSYWVEVKDTFGCSNTDSVRLVFHKVTKPDLGRDTGLCKTKLSLNPGNFKDYLWSTGSTKSEILVDTSGLFYVKVEDNNGCVDIDSILVTFWDLPIFALSPDTSYCGDSFVLKPNPSVSNLLWSNGSVGDSLVVIRSGVYWLQARTKQNCRFTDSALIILKSKPNPDLGLNDTFCEVDMTLYPGKFNGYVWSTGSTSKRIKVTSNGLYSVEVEGFNGCTARDSIRISTYDKKPINLGADTSVCTPEFMIGVDATDLISHVWNDLGESDSLLVNKSGWYWVIAKDLNSCFISDTIHIKLNQPTTVLIPSDTSSCQDSIVLNPGLFSQYLWNGTDTNRNKAFYTSSKSNTLKVQDVNGCEQEVIFDITLFSPLTHFLGVDKERCINEELILDPGSFASYLWMDSTVKRVMKVDTSAQLVWLEVVDSNSCLTRDTLLIKNLTLPKVNMEIDSESQCILNNHFVLKSIGTSFEHRWQLNSTVVSSKNVWDTTFSKAADYMVSLFVSDSNCHNTVSRKLTVYSFDSVTHPSIVDRICLHDSLTLPSANKASMVTIETGAGNLLNEVLIGSQPTHQVFSNTGLYIISYRHLVGCSDTMVDTVHVLEPPSIPKITSEILCQKVQNILLTVPLDTHLFSSFKIDEYDWVEINGSTDTSRTYRTLNPGISQEVLFLFSKNGCLSDSTIHMYKQPLPNPKIITNFEETHPFDTSGYEITLFATFSSNTVNINWIYEMDSGWTETRYIISEKDTGNHLVQLRAYNMDGCPSIDTFEFRIEPARVQDELTIPRFFSPNNDGINDELIIPGFDRFDRYIVFTLRGNEIYRTSSSERNWNGLNSDHEPVPSGTYLIILEDWSDEKLRISKQFVELTR